MCAKKYPTALTRGQRNAILTRRALAHCWDKAAEMRLNTKNQTNINSSSEDDREQHLELQITYRSFTTITLAIILWWEAPLGRISPYSPYLYFMSFWWKVRPSLWGRAHHLHPSPRLTPHPRDKMYVLWTTFILGISTQLYTLKC